MTASTPATARQTAKPAAADASTARIERPTSAGVNAPAFGSDVVAETLRALDIPYIAVTPGRELSRPARQHRQLSRQHDPADAAVRA